MKYKINTDGNYTSSNSPLCKICLYLSIVAVILLANCSSGGGDTQATTSIPEEPNIPKATDAGAPPAYAVASETVTYENEVIEAEVTKPEFSEPEATEVTEAIDNATSKLVAETIVSDTVGTDTVAQTLVSNTIPSEATIGLTDDKVTDIKRDELPNILWQTDHETGDFYEWSRGSGWLYWDDANRQVVKEKTGTRIFGQAIFNSNTPPGDCVATISSDISRSGNYALKLDLTGANKAKQGCRVFRSRIDVEQADSEELPKEGYYSAWYYIPQEITTAVWWNIFQFKSGSDQAGSEPMLSFGIDSDGNGSRSLYVFHKKGEESCDCLGSCKDESYDGSENDVNIPLNEWFQIEAFVKQSTMNGEEEKVNADGAFGVWVNGVQIIDKSNICTLLRTDARLQWSVNNYTDEITPPDVLLYIDDAAISTDRIGIEQN